jgi:hypothetical protein
MMPPPVFIKLYKQYLAFLWRSKAEMWANAEIMLARRYWLWAGEKVAIKTG